MIDVVVVYTLHICRTLYSTSSTSNGRRVHSANVLTVVLKPVSTVYCHLSPKYWSSGVPGKLYAYSTPESGVLTMMLLQYQVPVPAVLSGSKFSTGTVFRTTGSILYYCPRVLLFTNHYALPCRLSNSRACC